MQEIVEVAMILSHDTETKILTVEISWADYLCLVTALSPSDSENAAIGRGILDVIYQEKTAIVESRGEPCEIRFAMIKG